MIFTLYSLKRMREWIGSLAVYAGHFSAIGHGGDSCLSIPNREVHQ